MVRTLLPTAAITCLATALGGCQVGSRGPAPPVQPAVIQAAEASIVPVRCTDPDVNDGWIQADNGTGFVVGNGIVTASHVVTTCDESGPGSVSAGPYIVAVSANNPADDLALMRSGVTGAPLTLASSPPALGSSVELLGMPRDVTGATVEPIPGTVTSLNNTITLTDESKGTQETLDDVIVVDANAVPGYSGGPAINAAGQVVGVVEGGGGGQAYLTPAADVVALGG